MSGEKSEIRPASAQLRRGENLKSDPPPLSFGATRIRRRSWPRKGTEDAEWQGRKLSARGHSCPQQRPNAPRLVSFPGLVSHPTLLRTGMSARRHGFLIESLLKGACV